MPTVKMRVRVISRQFPPVEWESKKSIAERPLATAFQEMLERTT
jgi:hypothetical protein